MYLIIEYFYVILLYVIISYLLLFFFIVNTKAVETKKERNEHNMSIIITNAPSIEDTENIDKNKGNIKKLNLLIY